MFVVVCIKGALCIFWELYLEINFPNLLCLNKQDKQTPYVFITD